jgi:hypothetical protein
MCLYDVSRDKFISEVSVRLYKFEGPKTRNCTFVVHSQYNPPQRFMAFKEAYDSVRSDISCSILTESGIPMKLARLIKMC